MGKIFDLQNVSYTYLEKFEALKDVSLKMEEGEQIVVMGANGSGKSTLLSILAALIPDRRGGPCIWQPGH